MDRVDVLLPQPKRQAVKSHSGLRRVIERLGELCGFGDLPGLLVELDFDFDYIAFADPGGGAMGSADPYQPLPRMAATRVRQLKPLIVTVTGGRPPGPSFFSTVSGTSTPVALPEGTTFAWNVPAPLPAFLF